MKINQSVPEQKLLYKCSSIRHCHLLILLYLCPKLSAATWFPKSLPCDVKESSEDVSLLVDCADRRLTEVPRGIPTNVTNLTLTINHIPHISQKSFLRLQNLVEIDLRCNCVPVRLGPKDHVCTERLYIEDSSFTSLTLLKSLYLDGNQLLEIPRGLPQHLQLLSLEANSIFSITKGNLTDVVNLEILYLGQNCYYRNPCNVSFYIENDAFYNLTNLSVLSLKSNNITHVPGRLPSTLKELYLYNNMIQSIRENDFQNLFHLEILDLSANCPRCYNAPYPCIPCPNSRAIEIDLEAFSSLKNLKVLRLRSNSLRKIPSTWFKNTEKLQVLDLSQNFLAQEMGEANFLKCIPSLKELDFSFNYDLQVYPVFMKLSNTFSHLLSLERFRVRGYVFKELAIEHLRPLIPLKNLTLLDLGTNFIKVANLSLFQYFPALELVDLSWNKISPSSESDQRSFSNSRNSENHFGSARLQDTHYFMYDENARRCKSKDKENIPLISFVKEGCRDFGKTLDLSINNIFFINAKDFQHVTSFKCLNLSGNAIGQSLNGSELQYLKQLKYLDFSNNRLDFLYATAFKELTELEVLDLSNNKHYFLAEGITHMLNFTMHLPSLKKLLLNGNEISSSTNKDMESMSLEILEFKGNRLDVLWRDGDSRYLSFFQKLTQLKKLDISYNSLSFMPPGSFEGMPPQLSKLCLANNKIRSFNWGQLTALKKLEVLDLSNNELANGPRELSNCTSTISRLILKGNKIKKLKEHFLRDAYQLRYLDLSDNSLSTISKSSFPMDVIQKLDTLILQGNPFKCNCEAVWFVWWLNQTTVYVPRLATDVTCAGPGTHKDKSLIILDLYTCEEELPLVVLHSVSASIIICLMVIAISNHLYFWDIWYSYHFCSAKLKGYRRLPSSGKCYDAFIAYDTKDVLASEWVYKELVTILEGEEGKQINLCLEERDWVPGKAIFENLSECIRMSRKTVFVLTKKYAQSGHFKTAFYMAHQWLIDENLDVIIFIFLEKALQNSKYLRLRKRLCKGSVLEWPTNPHSQCYFWHCLRNALKTDNHMTYDKLFKEIA
ncbi:toll-like receptor 7 isoform X2 [Pleurodeles waltl]|uniref:toll-like receptor 7 isoform X2 n=1 Tax=Pleurodeles waltl TaxID=8319 RepID=UPI003709934C